MLTDCRVLNAHLWWIGILNLLLAFLNRYSQIAVHINILTFGF